MSTGDLANPQLQDALQRAKELSASQKRPASDLIDSNPAKRQVMDGGGAPIATVGSVPSLGSLNVMQNNFGMAGGGGGEPITEVLSVPDNCVGLIIGRKGEQISSIQAQSGCKVQMAQDGQSAGDTRQCTLTGDPNAIARAKARINEIIEKGSNRPPPNQQNKGGGMMNGGGNTTGLPAPGPQDITIDIMIPGNRCGLVIGKAGDTIKSLQERSGCAMKLIQDSTNASAASKPLRVIGTPQKVEAVKQMVDEILAKDVGNDRYGGGGGGGGGFNRGGGGGQPQGGSIMSGGGQRSVGEVIVPRSSVGMIIGKGGEMIKKLAADTGTRIQFKNDEPQDASERTAVLTGTVEQIQRATQLITDLVHRSMSDGQQETFYMHVPANKTGLVIGKGGETIKQINNESGAHVELNRETQNNPNEKVFIIKGTPYQIHVAKHLICIKVGDIPAGTPVGPFTGGGVTVTTTPAQQNHQPPQQMQQPFQPQYQQPQPMPAYAQPQPHMQAPQQWQPQQQPYAQPQRIAAMPIAVQPVVAAQPPAVDPNAAWQQPQAVQPAYQQPVATSQPIAYAPQPQPGYQSSMYAPAASAVAPQPQPAPAAQPVQSASTAAATTTAPAINPQTGQPDYSAQWAEYYRSQGMHEQANMIEAQARQAQQAAGQPQQQQPQAAAPQQQQRPGVPQQQQPSSVSGYQPQQQAYAQPATSVAAGGYPQQPQYAAQAQQPYAAQAGAPVQPQYAYPQQHPQY